MQCVARGMSMVAMDMASQELLRLQVVYVGKQVVVTRGHASMEELVRDFLQVSVSHLLWLRTKHLINHSTLTGEIDQGGMVKERGEEKRVGISCCI